MIKIRIPKAKKQPSGRWRIQFQIDGQRYSVTEDTKELAKEKAEKKAKAILAGIEEEKSAPLTVGKAIDNYISLKESVLSPTTIVGYKFIRKNVLQDIMGIELMELTQKDVQKAVGKDNARGVAPKTIRNAHGLLCSVLKLYRPRFVLDTRLPQKKPKDIQIFTEEELIKVWRGAEGTQYELPILFASWLGLRMSEIKGLRFSDICDHRIHIQRAVVKGENGEVVKTTKSVSGDRWIKLPDEIEKLIDALPRKTDEDYICPLSSAANYKGFRRICDKVGVKPCRFHDLRHFAASESHALGIPDKYSMKRMGHKTDNMLKRVYQHTMRDKEDEFADRIDEKMSKLYNTALKNAPENQNGK